MFNRSLQALALAVSVLGVVACGGGGSSPSGAVCDTAGMALTYANFGKSFMDTHCIRCHSSAKTGAGRDGAPTDQNFDTLAGVQAHLDLIDTQAASGPDGTNTSMPNDTRTTPSDAERAMLGQWLACGAQ